MFGQNVLTKPQSSEYDGTLAIYKIYATIQGEGPYGGVPSIFVRLKGCNLKCQWCVPGSTPIMMAYQRSPKSVDSIKVGDQIVSWDKDRFVPSKVVRTMSRQAEDLIGLELTCNTALRRIKLTPNHKVLCEGNVWQEAGDLREGMQVIGAGVTYWVTGIRSYIGSTQVYNLEAEPYHNYFADGLLVSNCDEFFDQGDKHSIEDIVKSIDLELMKHTGFLELRTKREGYRRSELYPHPLVVITGGEPFLQKGLPHLIKALTDKQYRVQLETAGSVWVEGMDEAMEYAEFEGLPVTIVCSPKTGKINKELAKHVNAWKYIIKAGEIDPKDGLPNVCPQTGKKLKLARPHSQNFSEFIAERFVNVYVAPCDEHDPIKNKKNMQATINVAMEKGYKVSLQTHKYMGLD